jgi:drug/metabolite transporter (DMT)-like permease
LTDTTPASRRAALLVVLIGACIIAVAPIFVRLAEAGPAAVGFWRLLFALPLLALLAGRGAGGVGPPSRLTLLAGLAFALDLAFWHYGITNTSVAKATVLANLTPVAVTAIAWLFLGQRPSMLFLAAVALAVAGAWIMTFARGVGAVGPNPMLGDALSITTAVWYALYFLAVSAARRSTPTTRIMFWSSAAGLLPLALAAWLLNERLLPSTAAGWGASLGLGVVHVTGQGAIAWALGRLPPATASVTVLIQPVVTTLLGWQLFGELVSGWQMLGGAIALFGVLLAQWSSRPAQG